MNQKGFISVPVIISIALMAAIIGTGGYLVWQKNGSPAYDKSIGLPEELLSIPIVKTFIADGSGSTDGQLVPFISTDYQYSFHLVVLPSDWDKYKSSYFKNGAPIFLGANFDIDSSKKNYSSDKKYILQYPTNEHGGANLWDLENQYVYQLCSHCGVNDSHWVDSSRFILLSVVTPGQSDDNKYHKYIELFNLKEKTRTTYISAGFESIARNETLTGWKTYTNSEYGYQVSYPPTRIARLDSAGVFTFEGTYEQKGLKFGSPLALVKSDWQSNPCHGSEYYNNPCIQFIPILRPIKDILANAKYTQECSLLDIKFDGRNADACSEVGFEGDNESFYLFSLGDVTLEIRWPHKSPTYPIPGNTYLEEEKEFRNIVSTFKFIESQSNTISNETGPNFGGQVGFPVVLGQCQQTTVAAIEFDSWREQYNVSFSNKGLIIIGATKPSGFAVGDPVNFCYIGHADPSVCEDSGANPGDLRPYIYRAKNLNTGGEIKGSPNLHLCGGA